jgi:hypothetical protein
MANLEMNVLRYILQQGTVIANGTTAVAVAAPLIERTSVVTMSLNTVGGTVSVPYVATITLGTGFEIKATALDTSTYNYIVWNQ